MTGAGADSDSTPGGDSKPQSSTPEQQEPGCMPIVVACTLLMGIVSFVFCGVTTWVLFQKRTEVAIRTLVGYVDVIDSFVQENFGDDERNDALKQISRLRRAIELGKATVIDVNDVLLPTTQVDTTHPLGRVLKQPLAAENIREVVQRAKLIGDREKLADQPFERKPIDEILKRELTAAVDQGGF